MCWLLAGLGYDCLVSPMLGLNVLGVLRGGEGSRAGEERELG